MIYLATCAGTHHEISEDTVVIGAEILSETTAELPLPETGFICVADGVGGNRGGADASSFVCKKLAEAGNLQPEEVYAFLVKTNEELLSMAKQTPDLLSMATTLTGIYRSSCGDMLIHIGNTRAYGKQGKYLKQLTSDHTTYNWLMSSGQLEAAEACNMSEITNCFGGKDPSRLSKLYVSEYQQFSLMVLTSDGVHDYVDLDALEDVLNSEGSWRDKCEEILRTAKAAGSDDDMTVVIICDEGRQQ